MTRHLHEDWAARDREKIEKKGERKERDKGGRKEREVRWELEISGRRTERVSRSN